MKNKYLLIFIAISFFISFITAENLFNISSEKLDKVSKKYGKKAVQRVQLWDKVIEKAKGQDILYQLKYVNDFLIK